MKSEIVMPAEILTETKAATGTCNNVSTCKSDLSATSVCHEEISKLAYEKWEAAGYPASDGIEFWLEAEAELSK